MQGTIRRHVRFPIWQFFAIASRFSIPHFRMLIFDAFIWFVICNAKTTKASLFAEIEEPWHVT